MKKLQVDNFGKYETQRIQENNEAFSRQFNSVPFLKGNWLRDIDLTSSGKLVEHKLRRRPQGYIVTKRDSGAIIFSGEITDITINLISSANVKADIWIF